MKRYHPVSPLIWDRRFTLLAPASKIVAFYIWTCPSRNSEGLSPLRIGHVMADTGLSEVQVRSALEELRREGYLTWDDASETILDLHALAFNPLRNGTNKKGQLVPDKRIAGAINRLKELPLTSLLHQLLAVADEHSPDFAAALREHFPSLREAPPKPLRRGGVGVGVGVGGRDGVGDLPGKSPEFTAQSQDNLVRSRRSVGEP